MYVEKTERILSQRFKEHQKQNLTACKQHLIVNPSHLFDYDNVKIFGTA